jgi:hypothetical protein
MNPMIFLVNSIEGYCGVTSPQEVLEVQGAGGNFFEM